MRRWRKKAIRKVVVVVVVVVVVRVRVGV